MSRRAWSLAVLASLAVACADSGEYDVPPRPVRVFTVVAASTAAGARYSAGIRAAEEVAVAFKVGGYVEKILQRRGADGSLRDLQAGDSVRRGEVLARLRTGDYDERVNQARSQVEEAGAAQAKAIQDFERAERLFSSGSLTRSDLDAAQAQRDAAVARHNGALAMLEEAQLALADAALTAPRDAVVLQRSIEAGSLVGPGSVGFLIADLSSVKAVFGAPETVIEALSLGDVLSVSTQSVGARQVTGKVSSISPSADPLSRVFEVEVTIPNPDGALKPGMIAAVALGGPAGADTTAARLTVPLSAVVRPPGRSQGYALYVVEGDAEVQRARLREITLGQVLGNRITVVDGVRESEQVIVSGATLVTDGEAVRIIPES